MGSSLGKSSQKQEYEYILKKKVISVPWFNSNKWKRKKAELIGGSKSYVTCITDCSLRTGVCEWQRKEKAGYSRHNKRLDCGMNDMSQMAIEHDGLRHFLFAFLLDNA